MTRRITFCLGAGLLAIAVAACANAAKSNTDTAAASAETTQPPPKPAIPAPSVPVPESAPPAEPAADDNYPTNPDAMPRVEVAEAAALREGGKAVILDVRDAASYERSHIAGALGIPLAELPKRLTELPHDKRILAYCS